MGKASLRDAEVASRIVDEGFPRTTGFLHGSVRRVRGDPPVWGRRVGLEDDPVPERWQSGRMRVFAKDVSGQKLDRGFESRPLRWLVNVELNNALFSRLQGSLSNASFLNSMTFSENLLMPGRA